MTISNREPDITIEERVRSIRVVIEIKRAAPPKTSLEAAPEKWSQEIDRSFETALNKAENQINNRKYRSSLSTLRFETNLAYAAAFLQERYAKVRTDVIFTYPPPKKFQPR